MSRTCLLLVSSLAQERKLHRLNCWGVNGCWCSGGGLNGLVWCCSHLLLPVRASHWQRYVKDWSAVEFARLGAVGHQFCELAIKICVGLGIAVVLWPRNDNLLLFVGKVVMLLVQRNVLCIVRTG